MISCIWQRHQVTSWSSNAPLEILLLQKGILLPTQFQWHTTFGLSILFKVVFCVYRLDFSKKMLEKVESLKDQVVFLGRNQSISLSSHDFSESKLNSIYFTDNRWSEMDIDYFFGGHNFGSFNLDDEGIKPF